MKIAIVGGGPRGLWAVEQLMMLAAERAASLDVTVFDSGRRGAVGAYEGDQPSNWLLNVRSSAIHTAAGSFDEWRVARGEAEPLGQFPPRRLVAEFLAHSWQMVQRTVPTGSTLRVVDTWVDSLEPRGEQWEISGTLFDEVLLVTGHEDSWPGALDGADFGDIPVIAPPYPAGKLAAIGPEDVVVTRGAALTFIDLTRACSPKRFVPVTRSGRFMEVKPTGVTIERDDLRAAARARVAGLASVEELTELLADYATGILERAGAEGDVRAVLEGTDAGDPVEDLRASYTAAIGERPVTPALAVGMAFNDVYSELVERASFAGRETLPGLDTLTRRLERVAFGPPPESARHLLELIDNGTISTEFLGRGKDNFADVAREAGASVIVDSTIAPPGVVEGSLLDDLVRAGHGRLFQNTPALMVEPDATVVGQRQLAAAGRMTEGYVLGNDTLNRTMHDSIARWAQRVVPGPEQVHGIPPMTARTEAWADQLLASPEECQRLLEEFGSPVNVLNPEPMARNIDELVEAAAERGVELKIFFARKANKGLVFVDTVRDQGHGVDVASENELRQVLSRGVPGPRIILSAAIKPDRLLQLAIDNNVTISADSIAELQRISALAEGTVAHVAPRLAPDPATMPPTRFGERSAAWAEFLEQTVANVEIVGLHVHLHGYAAADRQAALREAMALIDALRTSGHAPEFIDLGGGVPMSYLEDKQQWDNYHRLRQAMLDGTTRPFTWKSDPLNTTYPYYQETTRGPWLNDVLGDGIAEALTERGLRLHLEPGRSLLDGCGVILANVAFVKTRSDGLPLIGLEMNRTQCRTTSDDYLVDPVLVKTQPAGEEVEGYLVGAYCIEDELILRRRIRFPQGVAAGDVIAIPNTAGYFMHILESASHQIPLAKNVVYPPGELDLIDRA